MYIRLVLPHFVRKYGGEAGFFHEAYELKRDKERVPKWLRKELKQQSRWFGDNPDAPERIVLEFKRRRTVHGLCWFLPEAQEHIARARYVAWLMTEAGKPVREIRTYSPGQIFWRDENQIVAKSQSDMPRAF